MISVLLPTFNSCSTIVQAINSTTQQTFNEFELLILDDGSTDDTERIVSEINDARLKYHKLPHQGLTKILNYGLSIAQYDIIARMDADDLCVPWRFERQLSILKQLPRNTILSSWYGVFTDSILNYCVTTPTTSSEIKKGLLLHSSISHPGLMFFKDTLLHNGGYCNDVDIDAFQDYETWLKIKGMVGFHIIPEILVYQRFRRESLSNNISYKQKTMYSIQKPYYNDLQLHFGITDKNEENIYRGWREYFFGDKSGARNYWIKLKYNLLRSPRIVIAYLLTYLPEPLLTVIKESRVRFRLQYYAQYFSKRNRELRQQFRALIGEQ